MNRLLLILLLSGLPSVLHAGSKPEKAVVVVSVADLRSDQSFAPLTQSDDKQQTQLLFGETVDIVASSGAWVRVHAVEQPEFTTHQKWEGYPGWVLKDALQTRMPAKRSPPPKSGEMIRPYILETAEMFMGSPYAWGGLSPSPYNKRLPPGLTGVDCSGLVHLAYRLNGLVVPRDSMDQFIQSKKIKRKNVKPADLIFSASEATPQKITHVTLYAGGGQLIEAPQTGMVVRKIPFHEKYGVEFDQAESGQTVNGRVIYFGRLLKN